MSESLSEFNANRDMEWEMKLAKERAIYLARHTHDMRAAQGSWTIPVDGKNYLVTVKMESEEP